MNKPIAGWVTRPMVALLILGMVAVAPDAGARSDIPGIPRIDSITEGENWLGVAWQAPSSGSGSGITAYDIRRIESDAGDKNDGNWTVVDNVWVTGGGGLLHVLTGLEQNEEYDVQMRAVNANGQGAWSPTVRATPVDAPDRESGATTLPLRTVSDGGLHPLGNNRYPGNFNSGDDVDFYKIVVTTAQAPSSSGLWFASRGDTDTEGVLYDRGRELVRTDDGVTDDPYPENFLIWGDLGPGTYYLAVYSSSDTQGPYEVQVRTFPETSGRANAIALPLGEVAAGNLSESGDEDFFKLSLSSQADLILRSDGAVDTVGELQNSNGARLTSNDDGLFPQNFNQFLIRRTLAAGTYYLKVTGYGGEAIGPYSVHVTAPGSPGNTTATAQALALGDAAGGDISSASDTDYFSIAVDEDTYVTLWAVHNDSHIDADAELLDGSGRTLTADYLHDFAGRTGFGMEHRFEPGTHYLKVTGDSSRGKYSLLATENARFKWVADTCSAIPRSTGIDDSLSGCQWHLRNNDQFAGGAANDINVEPVWSAGNLGEGIRVAIVDDGLNHQHPDLRDNVDTDSNFDYLGTGEIYAYHHSHGTSVAGVVAARDNRLGMRGVAPRASIYGYNLLNSGAIAVQAQQEREADAMSRNAADTAVSNNSWGPVDTAVRAPAHYFWESAIETGLATGYGGKGTFYAWAGGNGAPIGDDSNLDEYANFYGVTAVCAVNHADERAAYSEPGSNLWVCAPSGNGNTGPRIATTENQGLFSTAFDGTSAATPQVSGLAALLRKANADLTWRDIKLILAASARKNDARDSGWKDGAMKYGSSTESYSFNPQYGFGVIDARAAVDLAAYWNTVPPLREATGESGRINRWIEDASSSGSAGQWIKHSIELDDSVEFIEFVSLQTQFDHTSFRDLEIRLVAPSGTVSKLVPYYDDSDGSSVPLDSLNTVFRLSSARYLGESSEGKWTIRVRDHHEIDFGRLTDWSITAYGHGIGPAAPELHALVQHPNGGFTVSWTAPGDTGVSAIASYDVRYIRSDATDKDADDSWTERTGISNAGDLTYRLGGLEVHTSYDVQVRAVNADRNGKWSSTQTATTGEKGPELTPACKGPDLKKRKQMWQGTLTVGEGIASGYWAVPDERMGWGYIRKRTGSLVGRNKPMVIGDNSYRVGDTVMQFDYGPNLEGVIAVPPGAFAVTFDWHLTAFEQQDLVLHICDEAFKFSRAEFRDGYDSDTELRDGYDERPPGRARDNVYYWEDSGLWWSEGLERVLTFSIRRGPESAATSSE